MPLEALYDCDFITIHTPLTREGIDKTFHLADAGFFSSLKPGAVFLNASRGAVVDSPALQQAIRAGRLQAVVLDVWEDEPDIDTGLLEMVDLGTPHIAGYSYDGKVAGMIMIYNALCAHFHLPPTRKIEDFLPRPEVPRLDLETGDVSDEELLARAVEQVYSIQRDDRNLRQIVASAGRQNAAGSSTTCGSTIPFGASSRTRQCRSTEPRKSLLQKLQGLGFKVEGRQ